MARLFLEDINGRWIPASKAPRGRAPGSQARKEPLWVCSCFVESPGFRVQKSHDQFASLPPLG